MQFVDFVLSVFIPNIPSVVERSDDNNRALVNDAYEYEIKLFMFFVLNRVLPCYHRKLVCWRCPTSFVLMIEAIFNFDRFAIITLQFSGLLSVTSCYDYFRSFIIKFIKKHPSWSSLHERQGRNWNSPAWTTCQKKRGNAHVFEDTGFLVYAVRKKKPDMPAGGTQDWGYKRRYEHLEIISPLADVHWRDSTVWLVTRSRSAVKFVNKNG